MGAIAGVILAAGEGTRLGGEKGVARFRGRSFLEGVLAGLRASVNPIVVVVSPTGEATRDLATKLGLEIVVNPRPSGGPISSLAVGLSAFSLSPVVDAAIVVPVDQVLVRPSTVAALVTRYREEPGAYVATHDGKRGHPVVLPRSLWIAVEEPSEGATLRMITEDATEVEVADPSVLWDVDTLEDLAKIEAGVQ